MIQVGSSAHDGGEIEEDRQTVITLIASVLVQVNTFTHPAQSISATNGVSTGGISF